VGSGRQRAHLTEQPHLKIETTSFGSARCNKAGSQDSFDVKTYGETVIAVVADGAGAARAGGEASSRIVQSLVSNYAAHPRTWSPQKSLAEFTKLINNRLYQDSLARFGSPEMVSTLAVAVIEGDKLYGLNVGDSRIYLTRAGRLHRLSDDHVLAENGFKHVLSRAVGLAPEVEPHVFEFDLADGDVAMLCTDGVTNVLDDDTLAAKLARRSPARSIVSLSREHATAETLDDMSAIVLDIEETGKLKAVSAQPFEIPTTLTKGDAIDGFTLVRPFQHSDRAWLATRDGQRFTLKFAPLEARDNEAVLNQFVKETWNATRLQSGFFPRAFVPEKNTTRCYAMEFIEAPSLKTLLRSRRLAADEAIALGRFLLAAAQYLLRLDLVHGDIKPENILVLSGYDSVHFKLVDFGSVAEIFSVTSRAGTASYLAPERFGGAPISERTEIFAIGVTLFESLTGAFPFGEIERFQTPRFSSPKHPSALNPNIPAWLDSVLLRALSPDPERRYQNFSEMVFDLDHPDKVEPFYQKDATLIERNPLLFYKAGFFILLIITIGLLLKLAIH
jgi:serine/threonine protein phosphatase PrpC